MVNKIQEAISSDYFKNKMNEDITIYEGKFCIYLDKRYRCYGRVYMKMDSSMSINFSAKCYYINENLDPLFYFDDALIEILGYQPFNVTIKSISKGIIKGYANNSFIKSKSVLVDYIDFNIVNFDKINGSLISKNQNIFAGRLEFDINEYKIIIDKRYDYNKDLKERLISNSGFLITHVGRIERKNKKSFKSSNSLKMIDRLIYALTFLCGRQISIPMLMGYSNNKNNYRLFVQTPSSECAYLPSWSDTISNHRNIEKYFSLFLKKLEDEYFDTSIKKIIDWYIEPSATLENNIITIQIALESLSYIITVKIFKILNDFEFDKNSASKNIKIALDKCRILYGKFDLDMFDVEIQSRFNDGVDLLTYLRNKVVHPLRKDNRCYLDYEDIWNIIQLGSRYIELLVLYFIEYKGEYSNRTKERSFGEIETVPWK